MSLNRIKPLPTASGVAVAKTATFDIPIGPRYKVIWLEAGDTAKDLVTDIIGDIRLKVNGKVQRTMSAAELIAINSMMGVNGEYSEALELDGIGVGAGHVLKTRLPIFLSEPWRAQLAVADGLAWGTADLASFQVEVDIKAAAAGPTLDGFVEADYTTVTDAKGVQQQPRMGVICKWFRQQIPINGTTQDVTTLPRRDFYQQISLFDSAITNVIVETDSLIQRDLTKVRNDDILVSRQMVPDDTRYDVVFDYDDLITSGLPMVLNGRPVTDFQLKLTLSDGTARNISTIIQRLGPPE